MSKQSKAKQVQYIAMADIEPNDGQLLGLPANPREIHEDKYKKLKKNESDQDSDQEEPTETE